MITTGISLTLYSQTYLPGRQIKILDDLLEETWAIYEKSEVDGLLPEDFQVNFKERYTKYVCSFFIHLQSYEYAQVGNGQESRSRTNI